MSVSDGKNFKRKLSINDGFWLQKVYGLEFWVFRSKISGLEFLGTRNLKLIENFFKNFCTDTDGL
jgi:hypothetical protein